MLNEGYRKTNNTVLISLHHPSKEDSCKSRITFKSKDRFCGFEEVIEQPECILFANRRAHTHTHAPTELIFPTITFFIERPHLEVVFSILLIKYTPREIWNKMYIFVESLHSRESENLVIWRPSPPLSPSVAPPPSLFLLGDIFGAGNPYTHVQADET
jgi:hypothetical protein